MINLSDLSDAELGALVRRSAGEAVMKKALEGVAEREAAEQAALAERTRLVIEERRRRRSLITLDGFKLRGVTFAPLNVKETQWDEVMPKGIATKYMRLIEWTFGFEFDHEDEDCYQVVTWRLAYALHSTWCRPEGHARKRFEALKKVLKEKDAVLLASMRPGGEEDGKKAFEGLKRNAATL